MDREHHRLQIIANLHQQNCAILVEQLATTASENETLKSRVAELEGAAAKPVAPLPAPESTD